MFIYEHINIGRCSINIRNRSMSFPNDINDQNKLIYIYDYINILDSSKLIIIMLFFNDFYTIFIRAAFHL